MRPYFVEYPQVASLAASEDAFFVGSQLLVHPVVKPHAHEVVVKFPADQGQWYELQTMKRVAGSDATAGHSDVHYRVELSTIPAFIRPGSVLPRKLRLRRSSKLMQFDPYTLFVAPSKNQQASGQLYMDDESTFGYEDGHFVHRQFSFENNKLVCRMLKNHIKPVGYDLTIVQKDEFKPKNTVERIVIGGQDRSPKRVVVKANSMPMERELSFTMEGDVLTIKKPDVLVAEDWDLELQY